MQSKRRLAISALWPMGDTEADVAKLQEMLNAEKMTSSEDPVISALNALFQRDGIPAPTIQADGSVLIQ
jgi:hypothetical protein